MCEADRCSSTRCGQSDRSKSQNRQWWYSCEPQMEQVVVLLEHAERVEREALPLEAVVVDHDELHARLATHLDQLDECSDRRRVEVLDLFEMHFDRALLLRHGGEELLEPRFQNLGR